MSKELIVSESELSLVSKNLLNNQQLSFMLKKTPSKYLKERPAKGGGTWKYVSGGYVKKCLNLMFGWDWDFEVIDEKILYGEAIVKGKLTVRVDGRTIVKMQFGNKDIMYRKLQQGETDRVPLSIGNDLKAAATDSLKKCAAELGIAADVYNAAEFSEVKVSSDDEIFENMMELFELKKEGLEANFLSEAERIINNKETKNYTKLIEFLKTA